MGFLQIDVIQVNVGKFPQKVKDLGDIGCLLNLFFPNFLQWPFSENVQLDGSSTSSSRLGNQIYLLIYNLRQEDCNNMCFNKVAYQECMSLFQFHLLRGHVLVVDPFVWGLVLSIVTSCPLLKCMYTYEERLVLEVRIGTQQVTHQRTY